jgi:pimeloyl-ACP methyl ester carboxylesterase
MGGAIVGGTISALTGGKFVNGAASAAFAAALRASWNETPVPENSQVAFVGGAADDNPLGSGVVKKAYKTHIDKFGKDSAAYFEWTQHEALAAWIDRTDGNATVIAHSYGADMAAQVVANGHAVNRLVTVDPVGWIRPDMSLISANSGIWQNYDAGDSLNNWNNIVATIGGAWNSAPQKYATEHKRYEHLDHVQICQIFCKY